MLHDHKSINLVKRHTLDAVLKHIDSTRILLVYYNMIREYYNFKPTKTIIHLKS